MEPRIKGESHNVLLCFSSDFVLLLFIELSVVSRLQELLLLHTQVLPSACWRKKLNKRRDKVCHESRSFHTVT